MTNDQQGHPSSKANNHFTCGACSSGCGWDCAAAPEGRRNFLVSRACCTVYCNLPGCCFHLRIGAKKTHPGSMGGGEMPLRKIAASLAENSGFSCDWGPAVYSGSPQHSKSEKKKGTPLKTGSVDIELKKLAVALLTRHRVPKTHDIEGLDPTTSRAFAHDIERSPSP